MSKDIVVVLGAGGIGQATARRQGFGKTILPADFNAEILQAATEALRGQGYTVVPHPVDVASRASVHALAQTAAGYGWAMQVVNTAGLSPNMAPPAKILEVDLLGVALVLEEFEQVVTPGSSGVVISSMAGYMPPPLPAEQDHALAQTPVDALLSLPFLQGDAVPSSRRPTACRSEQTTCAYRQPASAGGRIERSFQEGETCDGLGWSACSVTAPNRSPSHE